MADESSTPVGFGEAQHEPSEKRNNWIMWVLVAAVGGLIVLNVLFVINRDGDGVAEVDEPAPDFTLPLLETDAELGDEVELSSLEGKAVVLEFWATDCSACRQSFPALDDFNRNRPDDVVVVAVNVDRATPTQARHRIEKFMDMFGYDVPVAIDNQSVARAYGVDVIPRTVFIDKEGRVSAMHSGVLTSAELEREVASARE